MLKKLINHSKFDMDKAIIQQAILGDTKSFKQIFDHYLPKMRPVALRYAHTDFEADDILQDAFVKVYHHLTTFKHEGSFEGWIKRIVVNTALNLYKKNSTYNNIESLENIQEHQLDSQAAEEIDEIAASSLLKLINELPEGYRIVFNLYVFEDYSHKEIGAMLNISDGTSRSQYSKAKKLLKLLVCRQQNGQKSDLYKEDKLNGK